MMVLNDIFFIFAIFFVLIIPLVWITKPAMGGGSAEAAVAPLMATRACPPAHEVLVASSVPIRSDAGMPGAKDKVAHSFAYAVPARTYTPYWPVNFARLRCANASSPSVMSALSHAMRRNASMRSIA
jgi:hypothetical protein